MSVDVMPVLPGSSQAAPVGRSAGRDRQDSPSDDGESFASMVGRLVDDEPRKQTAAAAPAKVRSTAASVVRKEPGAQPPSVRDEATDRDDAVAAPAAVVTAPGSAAAVSGKGVAGTEDTEETGDASVAALDLITVVQSTPEASAPPPAVTAEVLSTLRSEPSETEQTVTSELCEVAAPVTQFPSPQRQPDVAAGQPGASRASETTRDVQSSRASDVPPVDVRQGGGRWRPAEPAAVAAMTPGIELPTEDVTAPDAADGPQARIRTELVSPDAANLATDSAVQMKRGAAEATEKPAVQITTAPGAAATTATGKVTVEPAQGAPAETAAASATLAGRAQVSEAAASTATVAEPRRAEGFSRQAANRPSSSSSETRSGSRAALGAEQARNAWQTDAMTSTTIARAVTASAAAIRLESDVFPARAAAVAQPAGQAVGVPFTLTIPSELKAVESAARTAVTHVATRAAESLDVPSQIVRSAQMQWRDGVGEATLRLTPENLGEVTISLRVEQGSVFATIRADSAAAMQAIQARQQELQTALEAKGLHLDHLVLSTDPDRSRDQQPPQHRGPKRSQAKPQPDENGETPRFEVLA